MRSKESTLPGFIAEWEIILCMKKIWGILLYFATKSKLGYFKEFEGFDFEEFIY